jgi:hypothetical protein
MDHRITALALLAALAAAPAFAQPAAKANPHAYKDATLSPECQKLKDEYIKSQDANQAARGGERDDGERAKGGHPEQKAMRKDFEARCGALPPEMTPKTKDDVKAPVAVAPAAAPAATAKPDDKKKGSLGEAIEKSQEKEKAKRDAARAAETATVAGTAAGAATTATAPAELPKKAGPAKGTGSDDKSCAQLHQAMKDALARKDACGKDKGCKQTAQSGYEQIRTAYQSGCGEVPADAKPKKG